MLRVKKIALNSNNNVLNDQKKVIPSVDYNNPWKSLNTDRLYKPIMIGKKISFQVNEKKERVFNWYLFVINNCYRYNDLESFRMVLKR